MLRGDDSTSHSAEPEPAASQPAESPATFDEFFSIERLRAEAAAMFRGHFDVIKNDYRVAVGADRIDFRLFQHHEEMHLSAASRKVLDGRYTFAPFLEKAIPKPESNEKRVISIASIRDGVVQRALYHYLYPHVDRLLGDSVYGYRRRRCAHDAVAVVKSLFGAGHNHVFDADIKSFFDRVDHDLLLAKLDELPIDERSVTIVRRFLKTGRITPDEVERHKHAGPKQQKYVAEPRTIGVPQGGVLSGLLSNLYLAEFDAAVVAGHPGYVRYADDFLVCCRSESECDDVHRLVAAELAKLKLDLHPKKTRPCVSSRRGVEFLGFHISDKGARVRQKNISRFKNRLRAEVFEKQRAFAMPGKTLRSLALRLQRKLEGPDEDQLLKLAKLGKPVYRYRRSWIGFFRVTDDLTQLRGLDRWIRTQVSAFMWRKHGIRVSLRQMQKAGLPSLVKCLWKAREGRRLVRDADATVG